MRKHIVLWGILIVLLIISLPGIFQRWNSEVENDTYEIAVPFEEIRELTTTENQTLDDSLRSLKDAGLTTISLEPLNLYSMEDSGIITVYSETDLSDAIRFIDTGGFDFDKKGYYITIPETDYYDELLREVFHPEEITIAGEPFYFIQEDSGITLLTSIGYDENVLDLIEEHDLHTILRVNNDTTDSANKVNTQIADTLLSPMYDKYSNILFSGEDVIGYPNIQLMSDLTQKLNDANYRFYTIEFAQQAGLQTAVRNSNYDVIRLHSIDLDSKTLEANINQAVRAVKERNIRSIFFHIQTGKPIDNLENAVSFVKGVQDKIPNSFQLGNPEPFNSINISTWQTIIILAAGVLFTYLAAGIFRNKWVQTAGAIFMMLLALFYLLSERLLLLQAFTLIISIITPVFAILYAFKKNRSSKISDISLQYLWAILISLIGIIIVTGLLNGNAFITGFEVFRGVKLVYILPIVSIGVILFYKNGVDLLKEHGISILQAKVKYWHLLIFVLIGVLLSYYVSRTGNSGTVSELELVIRSTLEDVLYVRPRTKEFLIGFPFFILALYVVNKRRNLGKFLLIPGTIGFLSMMNTFTHFHIPLYLSLLRTVYSIALGYIIGLLFIYLYKLVEPAITKVIRKGIS